MNKQLAEKVIEEAKSVCEWFKTDKAGDILRVERAMLRVAEKAHEAGQIAAREEGIY